jgi:hypothetical protein
MRSAMPPLEQFRALMEADAVLQQELSRPDDPALFIPLVVARARDHGIDLGTEQVAAALDATDPDAVDEHGARLPPGGWLPVRTRRRDRQLHVDWTYVGSQRLREPFFEESIARCLPKPFNRLFRYATPIDALADWLQDHPGLTPSGFIFHMSRCGSTLLSQMLAALPHTVVISEAAPIDAVVQARHSRPDLGDEQHAAWLRLMIGALGQPRSGEERHYVVKLDSWHTLALPLFRRAFPTTPWIFLYREPLEVLVSHLRRRGLHMVPGLMNDVFGFTASQPTHPPEIYCARVLERICDGVLQHTTPGAATLVNYRQLPAALWSDVLPHFGIGCSDADRDAMADAARYDAKQPERPFADDSAAKRQAATDAIRAAVKPLDALHAKFESLRRGG